MFNHVVKIYSLKKTIQKGQIMRISKYEIVWNLDGFADVDVYFPLDR
jgi:hypothetical protein